MDISELNTRDSHEEGVEINITHNATGEPTDVFITIVGPDSREWRRIAKASLREAVIRKSDDTVTDDQAIESALNQIVGITKGWRGITKDGEPVEFSKEACRELYSLAPYIMDQVDLAAGGYRDFTKG